jgi:23S rRNA (cytidine2498-2'-O)-methyltransferase
VKRRAKSSGFRGWFGAPPEGAVPRADPRGDASRGPRHASKGTPAPGRGDARPGRGPAERPARDQRPGGKRSPTTPSRRDARPNREAPAREPLPARPAPAKLVPPRLQLSSQVAPGTPPRPGEWLWTTREGAEVDLVEELLLDGDAEARVVEPALVASRRAPSVEGRLQLTFARQGFPVSAFVERGALADLGDALATEIASKLHSKNYALHVWVPDATDANPLAGDARTLEEHVAARLAEWRAGAERVSSKELGPESVPLIQVCLASRTRAWLGSLPSNKALSLAPGGRMRAHVGADRPSRAARKIAEALSWLELAPEGGEVCVDLGAAPGGWTWYLLERGARVIAVDPAKLRPDLLRRRGLEYVNRSAFEFQPEEPVDWLFCDMAWRPLEVAQLLARWARQKSATLLVANFKLPMKRKAEMVAQIRQVLEDGGWRGVRSRQLYHDRDEITVTARLG